MSLFSLDLQSTTYRIDNICLWHEWLKNTKIITKSSYIVDSTYTASYTDWCTFCIISIDRPFGAAKERGFLSPKKKQAKRKNY